MTHPISSLEPRYAEHDGLGVRSFDPETLEWPITNLRELVEHVEMNASGLWAMEAEMDRPEVLPEALCRGWITRKEGYKIDLARTIPAPHSPRSTITEMAAKSPKTIEFPHTLSLYIMDQNVEHCSPDDAVQAGIFVGIAPLRPNAGHRNAETKYHWTYTTTCDFSMENEYCAVELPLLSTLMENESIRDHDGFKLCIWIGPKWDSRPAFTVPVPVRSSTIRGLERLVDRDTGDIKFVCLEHVVQPSAPGNEKGKKARRPDDDGFREGLTGLSLDPLVVVDHGSASALTWNERPKVVTRKRVIYAHGDILEEKSEYFRVMLTSGFSDSGRYNTITVDDGDFNTLYWVIRYLYTNSITFASHTPVRSTVLIQQLSGEEKKKLLSSAAPYDGAIEWDFHTLPFEGEEEEVTDSQVEDKLEIETVRSVSSNGTAKSTTRLGTTSTDGHMNNKDNKARSASAASSITTAGRSSTYSHSSTPKRVPVGAHAGRPSAPSSSGTVSSPVPAVSGAGKMGFAASAPVADKPKHQSFKSPTKITSPETARSKRGDPSSTARRTPMSPTFKDNLGHRNTQIPQPDQSHGSKHTVQASSDAHPHPTPCPPDANALEVYFLANRYRLEALKDMAQEHLLDNMTVEDCMPMAFATYRYEELHEAILDYIVGNWIEVKQSLSFLRCVKEVRDDVWGQTGPLVLHNLFMRL
ncbi:hypothetical protein IAT40_003782 [Kwoniella sp. CBS 6097]